MKKFFPIAMLFMVSIATAQTKTTPKTTTVKTAAPKVYKSIAEANANPAAVKILELKNQNLSKLTIDFSKFTNLEKLDVSKNILTELPPALFSLPKLKILNVAYNQLTTLGDIQLLSQLLNLNADNNLFVNSEAELEKICQLKSLSILSFSTNKINKLPKKITELTNLTQLDLSYNAIKELPTDFGNFSKLKKFIFARNNITSFPASFFTVKELENIDISYNELKALQKEFSNLPKLEVMDCSFNKALATMPSMQSLLFLNIKMTKLDINKIKSGNLVSMSCNVML